MNTWTIAIEYEDIIRDRGRLSPVREPDEPLGPRIVEVRVGVAGDRHVAVAEHRRIVAVHELHTLELATVLSTATRSHLALNRNPVQEALDLAVPAPLQVGRVDPDEGRATIQDLRVLLLVAEPAHDPAIHKRVDARVPREVVGPADESRDLAVGPSDAHHTLRHLVEREVDAVHDPPDVHQVELRGQLVTEVVHVERVHLEAARVVEQMVPVPAPAPPTQDEQHVRVPRAPRPQDRLVALRVMEVVPHDEHGRRGECVTGPDGADQVRQPDPAVILLDDAAVLDHEIVGVLTDTIVRLLEHVAVHIEEPPGVRVPKETRTTHDEIDSLTDRGGTRHVVSHRLREERGHLLGRRRERDERLESPTDLRRGCSRLLGDLAVPLVREPRPVTTVADVEKQHASDSKHHQRGQHAAREALAPHPSCASQNQVGQSSHHIRSASFRA